MDTHLIELIVVNIPNFLGLAVCIFLLWKVLERYLPDDDDDDDT